jgi:hypothetical protein
MTRAWRLVVPAAVILVALQVSGCASISQKFADTMSQMPAIGLPAGAPERPADAIAYPAVHDMPPARTNTVLTDIEQQTLENDLVTARDHQQAAAGLPPPKKKVAPPKEKVIPVASSRTIY